jgi:hypothetical protein
MHQRTVELRILDLGQRILERCQDVGLGDGRHLASIIAGTD